MLTYQTSMSRFDSRTNRLTESVLQIRESLTPKLIQEFLPLRFHKATTPVPLRSYSPRPASGRGVGGEGYSIAALGRRDRNSIRPPHPQPFSPAKPGAKGAKKSCRHSLSSKMSPRGGMQWYPGNTMREENSPRMRNLLCIDMNHCFAEHALAGVERLTSAQLKAMGNNQ